MGRALNHKEADQEAYLLLSKAQDMLAMHRPSCWRLIADVMDRLESPETALPPAPSQEMREEIREWIDDARGILTAFQMRLDGILHADEGSPPADAGRQ